MSDPALAWSSAPEQPDLPPPPPGAFAAPAMAAPAAPLQPAPAIQPVTEGPVAPAAFAPAAFAPPALVPAQADDLPAPPAPPEGLATLPGGMPFSMSPGSALDLGAPLTHAAPPALSAQPAAHPAPPMPAAPEPAPPAEPAPAGSNEAMFLSGAMPVHDTPRTGAMPTFEALMSSEPAAAPAAAVAPVESASPRAATAPTSWWSSGPALVVGMLALAWQLVSFYAREQFPKRQSAGLTLDRFDTLFGSMPIIGSPIGAFVGMALAVAAGGLLLAGRSRGVREPVLQGAVAGIALVALLAPVLLMQLAG